MDTLENKLQILIALWKKRTELIEYSDEDNWVKPLLDIERNIEDRTEEITKQACENKVKLLEVYQTLNPSNKFIILHIMLLTNNSSLFETKLFFLEDIKIILKDESSNAYIDLVKAANFCPQSAVEPLVDVMLKSDLSHVVNSAYKIIGNLSLYNYERQCSTALKTIINMGELSEYAVPRSLLEAIKKIHVVSVIQLLENILTDEQLVSNSTLSLVVCETLISLGSKKGWDQYLEFCDNRKWSYEDTLLIGRFGNNDDHQFIVNQINSEPPLSWLCGYLYALGLSGSPTIVDILISYCSHSELDVRQHAIDAFYEMTGTRDKLDLDVEEENPGDVEEELKDWWEANQENFNNQVRYKNGSLFSLTQFIDDLSNESPIESLESLNSLIIYTAISLPYNADGYLKTRLSQQQVWKEWYEKNRSIFSDGEWFRWGKNLN